jgi:biopolymer transport protein ExbD
MALRLPSDDEIDGPVLTRRRVPLDNNLDMTPMIDVTFLLLIFFLVSSIPDPSKALQLPAAESGLGVSSNDALVITVAQDEAAREPTVYLADGRTGQPLPSALKAQDEAVRAAAEAAARNGKTEVLIKAEGHIRHHHIARLVRAAGVPGVSVNLAVKEMDAR